MNDPKKHDDTPSATAWKPSESSSEASANHSVSEISTEDHLSHEPQVDNGNGLHAEIERLTRENADLKDRVLRAMAEMENLRRRSEREVRDAAQYAISGFARDMLAVSDNLQRALELLPNRDGEQAPLPDEQAFSGFLTGLEMTEREFHNQLEKHKIRRLHPTGERFDPNFHQAMFEVEDASQPPGTVAQVVQAGYIIGERVLRPALVGVSKGALPHPSDTAAGDAQPQSKATDQQE